MPKFTCTTALITGASAGIGILSGGQAFTERGAPKSNILEI
jgi:hypothetical protein